MKISNHIIALIVALIIAPMLGIARVFAPNGVDALNTIGTHEGALVTRTAEVAITSGGLLVRKGTAASQVLLGTASARPLGTAYDAVAAAADLGVCLLGGGQTQIMIVSGAVNVDDALYTAANGKVSATATAGCWLVGTALTAATTDGQEVEVLTCYPQLISVPVLVAAAGSAVSALQAMQNIHLSNAGAVGAASFTLPPAVVGMRVTALVEAAQELQLDPDGTETIALPSSGVQGAAGKYLVADAVGEKVQLACITAGTWDVVDYSGTWTAQG